MSEDILHRGYKGATGKYHIYLRGVEVHRAANEYECDMFIAELRHRIFLADQRAAEEATNPPPQFASAEETEQCVFGTPQFATAEDAIRWARTAEAGEWEVAIEGFGVHCFITARRHPALWDFRLSLGGTYIYRIRNKNATGIGNPLFTSEERNEHA